MGSSLTNPRGGAGGHLSVPCLGSRSWRPVAGERLHLKRDVSRRISSWNGTPTVHSLPALHRKRNGQETDVAPLRHGQTFLGDPLGLRHVARERNGWGHTWPRRPRTTAAAWCTRAFDARATVLLGHPSQLATRRAREEPIRPPRLFLSWRLVADRQPPKGHCQVEGAGATVGE